VALGRRGNASTTIIATAVAAVVTPAAVAGEAVIVFGFFGVIGSEGIGSFFRGGEVFLLRRIIFVFLQLSSEEECEILTISQGFIIL
jgi:hypothetical protein